MNSKVETMVDGELTKRVIGCAFQVHRTLGGGFVEKVYENALVIELRKHELHVVQQMPLAVRYEGHIVGEYLADLVVEARIICELKAVESLSRAHEVQLVNYLAATGIDVGLLLNFGPSVSVRRKYRIPVPRAQMPNGNSLALPVNPENPVNPVRCFSSAGS